jgi:hypothetical protein
MVPSGTVPGGTPPAQGRPVPHQVEVQATHAPAATAYMLAHLASPR